MWCVSLHFWRQESTPGVGCSSPDSDRVLPAEDFLERAMLEHNTFWFYERELKMRTASMTSNELKQLKAISQPLADRYLAQRMSQHDIPVPCFCLTQQVFMPAGCRNGCCPSKDARSNKACETCSLCFRCGMLYKKLRRPQNESCRSLPAGLDLRNPWKH